MKTCALWLVCVLALPALAVDYTPFSDDFEIYPVSNPADFSTNGWWTWNGAGGGTGHDSRIFQTPNFGGSRLWICHPNALNSGITSAGIVVDANTDYAFVGNLVAETFAGARDNEFTVDLLIGTDAGSAISILGGPTNIIGRGDGGDGVPADAIDDSYDDQITTIPFSTAAIGPSDFLYIEIVYTGPGPSANPGFSGVDNVSILNLADADMDQLFDYWEVETFGSITNYTGADDPDFDSLDNLAEFGTGTDPLDPDTDGDGLSDKVETGTGTYVNPGDTGTSPLDPDADGDGVIDGAEIVVYESDPFNFDVDLDLAPDIVELTVGTDPNDGLDDPSFIYNLLWISMPAGTNWFDIPWFYYTLGDPGADDLYVVGGSEPDYGELIRTPEGAGTNYPSVFPLILSGDGAILRLKQDHGETVTVGDLRLRGGTVDNGNTGQTLVLDGAITVEASTLTNLAELVITATSTSQTFWAEGASTFDLFESSRGIIVESSIAGDQGLTVRSGVLDVRSMDNAFSGGWTVLEGALLKGRGLNSLGTGDLLLESGTLDADYNLAIMDSTLTVAGPAGVLVVDKDHYVGALQAGMTSIPAGMYTAAELVSLAGLAFTNSFVDGGGTVTVTGIGLGDADGNGIPDTWEVDLYGSNGQDPDDDTDDSDGLPIGQEFAAGTDPFDADSDGDTLNDGPEVFTHGTDPTNDDTDDDTLLDGGELAGVGLRPATDPLRADTDGDGLDDAVETNDGTFDGPTDTGTDPTNPDTDGDLFTDGVEVEEGSDPTDPNSVPTGFFDDFEGYPTSDPANFAATPTNWFWNGLGTPPNASRIFDTGNFGSSRLWIASAGNAAAGTGIDSRGIVVDPNKLYAFEGNLVCETFNAGRTATFTVDLLTGANAGSAASVVGGPVTFVARGDGDGSYTDQVSRVDFNTVGMNPSDLLFIKIAAVGTDASNPFIGVDNVAIVEIPDADGDLLPDDWEIFYYTDIYLYDGTDDPDGDLLDNEGEFLYGTDPLDPDTDGDDLADGAEVAAGTDPFDPDTDDDGLEDGAEVNTHGTDPLGPDSDGDDFSDSAEVGAGSDPLSPSSTPAWCSSAFFSTYEAIADVPSVENAAEGWAEADTAAAGAGILWSGGHLLIDSYDPSTNQSTAGGLWVENPGGGAWGTAPAGSYSVEIRARVLADAGDWGLIIWSGHTGLPGRGMVNITTNAVYWGTPRTTYLTDTNGIDNTTDFHVYRVLYDAGLDTYSVYRDSVLLTNGLAHAGGADARLIIGDVGGAGAVKAEVDYIRWEMGLAVGPDAATDDCDGDGLLNSEEDLNGNGSQDPGETDQGDADSDGDGSSDGDEVLVSGTDPLDPDSVFRVVDAFTLSGDTVEWSSVPGKTYRVQFGATVDPLSWTDLADVPASGTGTTSYTDPAVAGTEGYYRVLVLYP